MAASSVIPLLVGQGRRLRPLALGGLLWSIESGGSNTSRKDHAASTLCPAPVRKPWPGTEVVWRGSSPGVLPAQVPDLEMNGNEGPPDESSGGPRHRGTETAW